MDDCARMIVTATATAYSMKGGPGMPELTCARDFKVRGDGSEVRGAMDGQ